MRNSVKSLYLTFLGENKLKHMLGRDKIIAKELVYIMIKTDRKNRALLVQKA